MARNITNSIIIKKEEVLKDLTKWGMEMDGSLYKIGEEEEYRLDFDSKST